MSTTTTDTSTRDLEGLTALVTGATSGIGRAAAVHLATRGATVIVHGRDVDRGVQVVEEIELSSGHARFIPADLTDTADVARLVAEAGDVDILVNNAGFAWFGPTADLDATTLDRLFDANVRATYLLTAAVAPAMAARGRGSVINVGSMAASIGLAGGAAYSATKAALESFARSWAAEYGPAGVRVNAIAPGPVFTGGADVDNTTALGATTILGRGAQADEIAEAIGFLASPASSYITGTTLAVDAGRTAI